MRRDLAKKFLLIPCVGVTSGDHRFVLAAIVAWFTYYSTIDEDVQIGEAEASHDLGDLPSR